MKFVIIWKFSETAKQPQRSRPIVRSPTIANRKRSMSPKSRSHSQNETDEEKPLLATHALTFLVCGLKVRWKQVVAYELTSNSFDGKVVAEYTKELLKNLYDKGLYPRSVTMDGGPGNIPI